MRWQLPDDISKKLGNPSNKLRIALNFAYNIEECCTDKITRCGYEGKQDLSTVYA